MRDFLTTILRPRSYDGAISIAKGDIMEGIVPLAQSTLVRGALIVPGLIVMGIPTKPAIYGSLIGSANISVGLVIYYMLKGGK